MLTSFGEIIEAGASCDETVRRSNRFVIALAFAALAACTTRDEHARRLGEQARSRAAAACAQESDTSSCVRAFCEDACARVEYESPQQVCRATCVGQGACITDRDCAPPLRCLVVAPVVRQCGLLPPDAGF